MKNRITISIKDFVPNVLVANDINNTIVEAFHKRRKGLGLSRQKLAFRSGVKYATIRRFEQTGDISLKHLLLLAQALDCLYEFTTLFPLFIKSSRPER